MLQPLTILLFLVMHFQVPYSGFYIISNPAKKGDCQNELKMITGKSKVCISKKPIINIGAINYVTDIKYDPKQKVYYVDIGISSSGIQTLNKTVNSLPDSEFALVIKDDVVCLFAGSNEYAINSIRIGEDSSLKDLTIIHEALKAYRD